jgi:peroxiredoxin
VSTVLAAPDFSLPSTSGAPVSLADLHADGPALVLFVSEECPTCTLTLRRLAPLVPELVRAGLKVAAIFEDPVEVAARVARRTGFAGLTLSEPEPYDVSSAYSLESLPTVVLIDQSGRQTGRVVGWDADGLKALLSISVTDEPPRRKPGCAAKNTYDPESLRALDAGGLDELEGMFERGWSDGLPVVPPTRERVRAMLGGRGGGWDPDQCLGEMAPAMARVTLERVAACAVLAGCRPEYFPVVVAAVQAVLEPAFNVGGQAVTTQPVGQVVVVNGPVREAIGLNGSTGALGSGWRANMTIGRALRLVVSLTGGGYPGRLDRSTLGNPGKIGLCFAEEEESSPWEPLHVTLGFEPGQSVVTVFGADAPLSISDHRSTGPQELARVLGEAAGATWSPNWWPLGGTSLFVLCPEHARSFAEWGWSKQRVRDQLFEAVRRPAAALRWGETTPQVLRADGDQPIGKWSSPEEIVLVVAGGEAGRFSAVFGPCLGMDAQPISKEVPWIT